MYLFYFTLSFPKNQEYNEDMEWTFSLSGLLTGAVIMAAGGAVVVFHQKIADNLANGVSSYDKIKLVGVVAIIVGFIVMLNLHTLILSGLVNLILKR